MQGVWKYKTGDVFVNELGDESIRVIGYAFYPWYRVAHGFWDKEDYEYHLVEVMVMESSLDRWEKVEV